MKYKRILLKLSGEALMGHQNQGIDPVRLNEYAMEIKEIQLPKKLIADMFEGFAKAEPKLKEPQGQQPADAAAAPAEGAAPGVDAGAAAPAPEAI